MRALIDSGAENCAIILDEVDKIGRGGYHGDPESALLEILDPEQNSAFTDNYVDVPVDLSRVFFICTANEVSRISPMLLDRLTLVEFSSYSSFEKLKIFEQHVFPSALLESGLAAMRDRFELAPECAWHLVEHYSREAGVRQLKRVTSQLLQKIALKLVSGSPQDSPVSVGVDNLVDYIGPPPVHDLQLYRGSPAKQSPGRFEWPRLQFHRGKRLAHRVFSGTEQNAPAQRGVFRKP